MILEKRTPRTDMRVMHALQATNSHEFRRHPPGSLIVSEVREDREKSGWRVSVTLQPAPVHQFIDGGKIVTVDAYESVNFTEMFRGFRDKTAANRKEKSRRDRAFRRQQELLAAELRTE